MKSEPIKFIAVIYYCEVILHVCFFMWAIIFDLQDSLYSKTDAIWPNKLYNNTIKNRFNLNT